MGRLRLGGEDEGGGWWTRQEVCVGKLTECETVAVTGALCMVEKQAIAQLETSIMS